MAAPIKFTAKEREAVIDALNRVLAGEFDGEIPLRFYESALDKTIASEVTSRRVVDATGRLARDAAARVVGAYHAGAHEAAAAHFHRFMKLWDAALVAKAEA